VVLRIDIGIVDETVRRLTAPGQPLEVSEREFAGATHRVFVHAAATAVDVIQSLRVHGDAELLVFNDRLDLRAVLRRRRRAVGHPAA
jgi:hypothetical protein